MKTALRFGLAAAATIALAACGNDNTASEDATAESVEVTADEALEDVTEQPIADPAVAPSAPAREEDETEAAVEATVQEDAENAAAAAEDVRAALREMEGTAETANDAAEAVADTGN